MEMEKERGAKTLLIVAPWLKGHLTGGALPGNHSPGRSHWLSGLIEPLQGGGEGRRNAVKSDIQPLGEAVSSDTFTAAYRWIWRSSWQDEKWNTELASESINFRAEATGIIWATWPLFRFSFALSLCLYSHPPLILLLSLCTAFTFPIYFKILLLKTLIFQDAYYHFQINN